MERKWQKLMDPYLGHIVEQAVQVPVMINYKVGKKDSKRSPTKLILP